MVSFKSHQTETHVGAHLRAEKQNVRRSNLIALSMFIFIFCIFQ